MKLLFDENLSEHVLPRLHELYPGSSHVKLQDLQKTEDTLIWRFAKVHGFTIVSKDSDFYQRSLVFGAPPKVIYLQIGNSATGEVIRLLSLSYEVIRASRGSSSEHPSADAINLAYPRSFRKQCRSGSSYHPCRFICDLPSHGTATHRARCGF